MSSNYKIPILLIEDNPGDAHLIEMYMKDSSVKHEFYHAESFFDGADLLNNQEISLVLLDLSLPDSNGFKTLTSFLDKFPNTPVIVLTGLNNEIIGNQAVKAGAQDFLVKGQFDGKLLGRSIRYSIQRFKTQVKLEETARNLAISEKRYVEAQEMAHFGNWEMDIVSNEMKWTDEIYRIFGFNPNSIAPTLSDYFNYTHHEDRPLIEDFFEKAAKDGQMHTLEHRIVIDGRSIRYVAIQAKVYYDDISDKILLVGALQDITQRKLNEQLIIEKNISNKASKIKEEALTDIGFHIRTPLSSIVNLLYLMEKSSASNQQIEYINGLKTSVDDLSIMVNNLLNFSVLASEEIKVEYEEIQIKELMQSIQKVVQIKSDKSNIRFDFDLDKHFPEKIQSDPNKMTQIIYNLIDYGIHYAQSDGEMGMLARVEHLSDDEIKLCFKVSIKNKVLSKAEIQDLREAEKLLEVVPEEGDDNKKSLIGIAIVNKLVQLLKGNIEISSKEDSGTQFDVQLPAKVAKRIAIKTSDRPVTPLKILLVEDHFLNQIATKKVLTTWSDLVSVDIAENGLVGVEKYKEHGYDLILMDIQMPVMNGIEASMKVREFSNVPIIALTANSSKQEANRCMEIGINDYLSKPFKPRELHAKIMSLLVAIQN
ncbi:MAG: response regulator [Bacteroidota bacterium]